MADYNIKQYIDNCLICLLIIIFAKTFYLI